MTSLSNSNQDDQGLNQNQISPQDTLILTFYLRPITALPPPAYGPLGLSFHLINQNPNLNLKIIYEDGQNQKFNQFACSISKNQNQNLLETDQSNSLRLLDSNFKLNSNPQIDQNLFNSIWSIISPLFDLSNSKNISILSSISDKLNHHLTLRTYFIGYHLSLIDWTLWGIIKSSSTFIALLKKSLHPHLNRWFSHIDSLPSTQNAINTLNDQIKNSIKARSKPGVASSNFDQGLPGAIKGQVVTRFPPEPSGYLHIGHCKAAILNQHYAKTYQGKFLIRFDDTNPSKEKEEFQDAIIEDLKLLAIKPDQMSYTSDYFNQLYKYALEMISLGKAYCDDTEQETMKAQRLNREPSKRRDTPVEENLARFDEMKNATNEGLRWCLRAKIRYDDLNGTLRDPVIYRCNILPHHRTGEKWKIYPTYDFACPIVDSIEGVTHALRTNEYRDRNPQYWWMQEALGLRRVEIKDFARVNFVYTLLSKRKLKWFVETGRVRGWDDPRFATVRGIRRRGMTIQAIRDFMIGQGDSQQQVNMEWDVLWSLNKRIIDPIVPRHTAITNRVTAVIKGGQGVAFVETLPAHKKNPELGNKKVTYSPTIYIEQQDVNSFDIDEEITLMDWGNAIVRSKSQGPNGIINHLELDLYLEGDFKKTKKKVHWLGFADSSSTSGAAGLQNVLLLDYDYLITKKKIEEEDEIDDFITPVSEFIEEGIADGNICSMKKGDILQFERKGYYIVDKPLGDDTTLAEGSGKDWMELIRIPDGRAAGLASKADNKAPC
ncbi:hypothetical protein O181_008313 [Austropuccinia psidii MF-1]|uniref:glutamate--tRNA ligase n=1 Tax=Austropuccinia psidii MF-1 TaxID=1389203 RepID=A0A9Q3BP52_9BASI|nr:hypothetical protein [Austropuccinia psidii MF-1]